VVAVAAVAGDLAGQVILPGPFAGRGGEAAQAAGGIPGINEGETVLSFPQQVVGRVVGEFQLAFAVGTLGVQLFDAGADQAVEAVPDEVMNLAGAGDADQTIALVVGVLQGAAVGTLAPDDLAEKVALETGLTPGPVGLADESIRGS